MTTVLNRPRQCRNCPSPVRPTDRFCPNCGADRQVRYDPSTGEQLEEPLTPAEGIERFRGREVFLA